MRDRVGMTEREDEDGAGGRDSGQPPPPGLRAWHNRGAPARSPRAGHGGFWGPRFGVTTLHPRNPAGVGIGVCPPYWGDWGAEPRVPPTPRVGN